MYKNTSKLFDNYIQTVLKPGFINNERPSKNPDIKKK